MIVYYILWIIKKRLSNVNVDVKRELIEMHQVDRNVEWMTMLKKVDQGMATLMGYK